MTKNKQKVFSLDRFWAYQVIVLADKIGRHTRSIAKLYGGLNLSQWRVLAAIGDRPGRISTEVVAVTPMDKGIVSRSVVWLIRAGLVEKTPDASDRRRIYLKLTRKGRRLYNLISRELTGALSCMAVDEDAFLDILKDFIKQMPEPIDKK